MLIKNRSHPDFEKKIRFLLAGFYCTVLKLFDTVKPCFSMLWHVLIAAHLERKLFYLSQTDDAFYLYFNRVQTRFVKFPCGILITGY